MSNFFNITRINENTIKMNNQTISRQTYINLFEEARKRDYTLFFKSLHEKFGYSLSPEVVKEIHQIARVTQICVKGSRMLYVHGFVLYQSLETFLNENPDIQHMNIIETGTACGFSALCMALALKKNNRQGTIYTFENYVPHNVPIFWNCIKDFEGKHTRPELLKEWDHLLGSIQFLRQDTLKSMNIDGIDKVHFSFLDAQHDYTHLNNELQCMKNKNCDVIICDYYTWYHKGGSQYPGIIKAVDDFVGYNKHVFYCDDGTKKRGYVYMSLK